MPTSCQTSKHERQVNFFQLWSAIDYEAGTWELPPRGNPIDEAFEEVWFWWCCEGCAKFFICWPRRENVAMLLEVPLPEDDSRRGLEGVLKSDWPPLCSIISQLSLQAPICLYTCWQCKAKQSKASKHTRSLIEVTWVHRSKCNKRTPHKSAPIHSYFPQRVNPTTKFCSRSCPLSWYPPL